MTTLTKLSLLHLLGAITITLAAITMPIGGYNGYDYYTPLNYTEDYFKELILDIYVDETGKALVTGYVEHEDVVGENLPFLALSEYTYDNDTNQLYALTNALTCKFGDRWLINFTTDAYGYYTEYHTIFYLPGDVTLGEITCSQGLAHSTKISNDSFVIDIQGSDVVSPMTAIEYLQPLDGTGGGDFDSGFEFGFGYFLLVIALAALALSLIVIIARVKKREKNRHEEKAAVIKRDAIETTADMLRVMETLTDRERAIVNALLKHNGEMTQADLRYETGIPKSSLTGILRSLERRKIIIKKEWGRTNVIELSEWFLSKGERK